MNWTKKDLLALLNDASKKGIKSVSVSLESQDSILVLRMAQSLRALTLDMPYQQGTLILEWDYQPSLGLWRVTISMDRLTKLR